MSTLGGLPPPPPMRLAPLSASEIEYAVAAVRGWSTAARLVFFEVDLLESITSEAKAAVLRGDWEALPPRRARVVAADPEKKLVIVGDVAVAPGGALIDIRRRFVSKASSSTALTLLKEPSGET